MMELFQEGKFRSHAGLDMSWKIEMDSLTYDEWKCIAQMIMDFTQPFERVVGVPRGGTVLANILNKYATDNEKDPICLVDDVMTTGGSMIDFKANLPFDNVIGWVVFARGPCPYWVNALFRMPYMEDNGDIIKMLGMRN